MKTEKLQGLAHVLRVEIPEVNRVKNVNKGRCDIKVFFRYHKASKDAEVNEDVKKMSEELVDFAGKAGQTNEFSYLLDATRLDFTADKQDEALALVREKLLDKNVVFTTYRIKITDLLEGTKYDGITSVHSAKRAYSSFSTSFLLINDDEEGVFNALQARLLKRIENAEYKLGRTDTEHEEFIKALANKTDNA